MLCAYDAPELSSIDHVDVPSAVRKGYRILSGWSANPNIASKVRRLGVVMRDKGVMTDELYTQADNIALAPAFRPP
jgi:hypothetical protein